MASQTFHQVALLFIRAPAKMFPALGARAALSGINEVLTTTLST